MYSTAPGQLSPVGPVGANIWDGVPPAVPLRPAVVGLCGGWGRQRRLVVRWGGGRGGRAPLGDTAPGTHPSAKGWGQASHVAAEAPCVTHDLPVRSHWDPPAAPFRYAPRRMAAPGVHPVHPPPPCLCLPLRSSPLPHAPAGKQKAPHSNNSGPGSVRPEAKGPCHCGIGPMRMARTWGLGGFPLRSDPLAPQSPQHCPRRTPSIGSTTGPPTTPAGGGGGGGVQ